MCIPFRGVSGHESVLKHAPHFLFLCAFTGNVRHVRLSIAKTDSTCSNLVQTLPSADFIRINRGGFFVFLPVYVHFNAVASRGVFNSELETLTAMFLCCCYTKLSHVRIYVNLCVHTRKILIYDFLTWFVIKDGGMLKTIPFLPLISVSDNHILLEWAHIAFYFALIKWAKTTWFRETEFGKKKRKPYSNLLFRKGPAPF